MNKRRKKKCKMCGKEIADIYERCFKCNEKYSKLEAGG